MQIKQRNFLIDNSKGLLIFLVVFGHSLELVRRDNELIRIIYVFIYLFHMPVFVFISGYLSKNIEKGRKNATSDLLIPFLFFNTIWNILQIGSYYLGIGTPAGVTSSGLFSFFTPGWGLWYILAMFLWRLFLPDILKIKRAFLIFFIIGLSSGLFSEFGTFMSLSRMLAFTPFFLAGYYTTEDKIKFFQKFGKIPSLVILIAGIIFAALFVKASNIPDEFLWQDRSYNYFNIATQNSIMLTFLGYIIGFLFVYVFINLVSSKKTFLSKLGRNTLSVYLLHTYFIGIIIALASLVSSNLLEFTLIALGSLVVTYSLSRDTIAIKLNKFLKLINSKIFVEGKEK